jgi:hypothetical protein
MEDGMDAWETAGPPPVMLSTLSVHELVQTEQVTVVVGQVVHPPGYKIPGKSATSY